MDINLDQPAIEEIGVTPVTVGNVISEALASQSNEGQNACAHAMTGRNLVLCIDGASNQFGEKNTNVIELYNLVLKEVQDNQPTWYNSGIGTYARPSWKSLKHYRQVLSHKLDLASAWRFKRTVLAAYRWLSDNYQPGDCIFLFGFSRGAYQVRVISAMIDKVGLIRKGNDLEMKISIAYELYADPESNLNQETVTRFTKRGNAEWTQALRSTAEFFKSSFSHKDVKVHFVGAWDTVSSIGIARGTHILPRTVDGMKHVCYFRHALALDERRVKFLPEYAYGGSSKPPGEYSYGSEDKAHPQTLEVWFAGTHADMGGDNVENIGMDRSRPPLRWMVLEAQAVGLRTVPLEYELSRAEQIEIKESLIPIWWPLEILPLKRLTYTRQENGVLSTRKPHFGFPRKIHKGQKIHSSFLLADGLINGRPYTPKARPVDNDPVFWQNARANGLGDWLELDLYENIETLVKLFVDTVDVGLLENLNQFLTQSNGQQAVYESLYGGVICTLEKSNYDLERKWQLLNLSMEILENSPFELKESHSTRIRASVLRLLFASDTTEANWTLAKKFLQRCTNSCIHVLRGHSDEILSVAYSPNGKYIASGSSDRAIYIWDSKTGMQIGEPLQGHTHWVRSVAFSPDGKHIVSGSDDHTIRLWDFAMGKQIGEPFVGHTDWVTSVAFSPDGMRFISGSVDNTLRIWNRETGELIGEPLKGHTNGVISTAFSPDGTRIVSGSGDCEIRLWDSQTRVQIGQAFTGHTSLVMSVAFLKDGNRIVSGSWDKTIRIWDAETGKQVGKSFQGQTDGVCSVALSPDGQRIVSCSDDRLVRLWDVDTMEQLGEPYRGHTDCVWSVVFSPDGKHIASGSLDSTVCIWDAETYDQAAD